MSEIYIYIRLSEGEKKISLREFEKLAKQGEIHPSTEVKFPLVTNEKWIPARELELFSGLYSPELITFARYFRIQKFPSLTFAIVLINIFIYYFILPYEHSLTINVLANYGAKVDPYITELGEWYRLFTANFLHRDAFHLVFNMFFLFNICGVLENIYRPIDFLFIIITAALSTTLTSMIMDEVVSFGASGIVLGAFGAAAVFGFKYDPYLPMKYRRYFMGAVIPYALFILYLGLLSNEVDNWGHVGGLLAGIFGASICRAKLLLPSRPETKLLSSFKYGVLLLSLLVPLSGQWIITYISPRLHEYHDHSIGLEFSHPHGWERLDDFLGFTTLGNGFDMAVAWGVSENDEPASSFPLLWKLVNKELRPRIKMELISDLRLGIAKPYNIDGIAGYTLPLEFLYSEKPFYIHAYLWNRGELSYAFYFIMNTSKEKKYAPMLNTILQSIHHTEPTFLTKARKHIQDETDNPASLLKYARANHRLGNVSEALKYYQLAQSQDNQSSKILYYQGKLIYDYLPNEIEKGLSLSQQALEMASPKQPQYYLLFANLLYRAGKKEEAISFLQKILNETGNPIFSDKIDELVHNGLNQEKTDPYDFIPTREEPAGSSIIVPGERL